MSLNLNAITIVGPGSSGLNLQAGDLELSPVWATRGDNCILDTSGRSASRKGWAQVTTTPIGGTPNIQSMGEYLKTDGTAAYLSGANNVLYSGTTTLTSAYSTSITANSWQMVNFNDYLWLFQLSHAPLRWDGTTVVTVASLGGAGTVPQADAVCAAYGRLWVGNTSTDKTTLSYSDTLLGHVWSGGAAGTIDLKTVWTNGMDNIVAIAAYNGFLIIFGKKSILVYQGPTNPATMTLVEHIKGIGCVARDSVKVIGDDLVFLSNSGLRSLGRTIQEKSMPLRDISKNVRDDLLSSIVLETASLIRAEYFEVDGFYLLSFPTVGVSYYFDMRKRLEDGSVPVFKWNGINPKALLATTDRKLYMGQAGVIGQYSTYQDNTSSYLMSLRTAWLDFGERVTDKYKILKKIISTVVATGGLNYSIVWAFDYSTSEASFQQTIPNTAGSAEYNIAEYGIAEYGGSTVLTRLDSPGSSLGKVIKVGADAVINGKSISIQKLEVYVKIGRKL